MDTALRVDMPAHTVAALLAGQLEIIVEDLHILVQLRQVADRLPGQRAVPVGQQTVFKIHNGFHFQAPPGAVMGVVLVILHGVPQQSQMIPLPQDMIQCLHGAALPDVDVEPLNGGRLLQIIHRRIGGIGGVGDHYPQFGAALLLLLHAPVQPVHLPQHPLGLLDEVPPLLRGDHAGG